MFNHDACAELMGGLRGPGADFQNLAEGAECDSSCLGGVIGAGVGDYHDPEGVAPSGMAVGRE